MRYNGGQCSGAGVRDSGGTDVGILTGKGDHSLIDLRYWEAVSGANRSGAPFNNSSTSQPRPLQPWLSAVPRSPCHRLLQTVPVPASVVSDPRAEDIVPIQQRIRF